MNNINKNINRGQKIYRSVKFIGKSVKFIGTKGTSKIALKTFSKANLATASIDATLSVLDAFNSYYNYKKEKEKTKQLVVNIRSKRIEIENLNKEISSYIEGETLKIENCNALSKTIDNIREPTSNILRLIENLIMEYKDILDFEKFEALNSKLIVALEKFYKLTESQI